MPTEDNQAPPSSSLEKSARRSGAGEVSGRVAGGAGDSGWEGKWRGRWASVGKWRWAAVGVQRGKGATAQAVPIRGVNERKRNAPAATTGRHRSVTAAGGLGTQ